MSARGLNQIQRERYREHLRRDFALPDYLLDEAIATAVQAEARDLIAHAKQLLRHRCEHPPMPPDLAAELPEATARYREHQEGEKMAAKRRDEAFAAKVERVIRLAQESRWRLCPPEHVRDFRPACRPPLADGRLAGEPD